ncbi:MAG: hypothetical protein ACK500_05530 [Flavobacteriales bacterium]|jgi:hypothetical protein
MNAIHLHLIANHIPILGSVIGLFVLLAGFFFRNREVRITAAAILLFASIGGVVTNKSGEEAEEVVEDLPGVSHDLIHEHEEMAEKAMPFILATAVLAAASLFGEIKRKKFARIASLLLLISALGVSTLSGYAGYLGGKIRHPEIDGLSLPATGNQVERED